MRLRSKANIAMLAVFAIVMHTVLWAVAMLLTAAAGAFDPFSVICHSGGSTQALTDQTPGAPVSKPTAACDHFNLCSTTGAASAPDVVLAGHLMPERVLAILSPASVPHGDGITSDPKLARGPPQHA